MFSCHLTSCSSFIHPSKKLTPLLPNAHKPAASITWHTRAERRLHCVNVRVNQLTWGGDRETTGRDERTSADQHRHTSRRRWRSRRPRCSLASRILYPPFLIPTWQHMRYFTALPVGALPSHCIFPVRNDVGSVVRDDVVVILSIWGKGLGGTGHLGLQNVEQIFCSLSGQEKKNKNRKTRGRMDANAEKVLQLRVSSPLSASSSQSMP